MSNPGDSHLPRVSVDLLVGLLTAGDAPSAEAFVVGLLQDGVSRIDVIREVLGPALARIGQLWERAVVSVAIEHRATHIVEGLLQATLAPVPVASEGHRVWLTGVEGEWHTMPARLVAGVWACLGWEVVALTPSLPAEELRYLAETEATRIAGVSCSLASNLVPAWKTISVLRECGFRVMVGGRAFDIAPEVAQIVGADEHQNDPVAAGERLAEWAEAEGMPGRGPARQSSWTHVEPVWSNLPRLVQEAVVVSRELAGVTLEEDVLREDISLIARVSCAAALTSTPLLLTDHLTWLRALLRGSDIDPAVASALVWSLERVLPAGHAVRIVLAEV